MSPDLIAAMPDPEAEVRLWRQLAQEAAKAAWAEGYRIGYERGARIAEADAVHVDPNEPCLADLEELRWGPGGRERFADPRPGDGRAAEVRRDGYRSGLIPAGMVHMGGPPVHGGHRRHGLDCTAACRAYRPGWYTYREAARIMASLPACPAYREEIARLNRLAGEYEAGQVAA